jgi:hypothetical protein
LHHFQKAKTLCSGTPNTYTLVIAKTDSKKITTAPKRTQAGNFKSRLQEMRANGTVITKKMKKNSAGSDMIPHSLYQWRDLLI